MYIFYFALTKLQNLLIFKKQDTKFSQNDREKEKETGLETYNEDGQKPIHFWNSE